MEHNICNNNSQSSTVYIDGKYTVSSTVYIDGKYTVSSTVYIDGKYGVLLSQLIFI